MRLNSTLVHGSKNWDQHTGAISFPIYQSATFCHPGLNQSTGYAYSRDQNPTREEVEKTLAILEKGSRGLAFSSGVAALATLYQIFSPGDHFIVSDDLYGGTFRLFEQLTKNGLEFTYLDIGRIELIEPAIRKNTRGIFLETPSNPMMKVADIKAVAQLAQANKVLTIVDNTFLTPYFQRPLELGADIVLHSGTKYLGGHNDTLAGFLVVKDEELGERLKYQQMSVGAVLSPFDSWLILRGLKTLGLRLERQQQNAIVIAHWLQTNDNVEAVYYVGLPDHPNHDISQKQATGFGAMISFKVKQQAMVERILGNVRLISFAESLGGVESLITYPLVQTHSSIPKKMLERLGIDERLLRLSVGIEDVEDLILDLDKAMC